MTERLTIECWNPQQAHQAIKTQAWPTLKAWLMAGHRMTVEVRQQTRTDEQNKRLWAMLSDISSQVDWYGQKLVPDEWKDVFTAALKKEKVVPGINGGFVVLGQRTSKMTKAEMSELQTLMEAFGAEKGVIFKEPHAAV